MTPRQQAEEIKIAMVRGSWNDSLDILEGLIAERERLREALESLWIEHPFDSDEPDTCAWCGDYYPSHDADCRIGDALSPVPPGAQAEQRGRYERERRLLEVNAALIKACTGFVLWERSSFESGKPREANLLVRALVDCHKALQLVSENYVTPGAQSGESE
jgi:hypothetical protein